MKKRYVVKLTPEGREQLEHIANRGHEAAYRRRHAQALLWVDEGEQDPKSYDFSFGVAESHRFRFAVRFKCPCHV